MLPIDACALSNATTHKSVGFIFRKSGAFYVCAHLSNGRQVDLSLNLYLVSCDSDLFSVICGIVPFLLPKSILLTLCCFKASNEYCSRYCAS